MYNITIRYLMPEGLVPTLNETLGAQILYFDEGYVARISDAEFTVYDNGTIDIRQLGPATRIFHANIPFRATGFGRIRLGEAEVSYCIWGTDICNKVSIPVYSFNTGKRYEVIPPPSIEEPVPGFNYRIWGLLALVLVPIIAYFLLLEARGGKRWKS